MKWGTKHPPPFTRYLASTPDNRIPFVYVEMFVVMWLYLEPRPRDKVRGGDPQPVFGQTSPTTLGKISFFKVFLNLINLLKRKVQNCFEEVTAV